MPQIKYMLLILLLTSSNMLLACSCNTPQIDLPIAEMGLIKNEAPYLTSISDLIFEGVLIEVVKVEEDRGDGYGGIYKRPKRELTFKVNAYYKGTGGDTIKVRTNPTSDTCGFYAGKNTNVLIFTRQDRGIHYTYRSDCCKSISKEDEPKRYRKYIQFLDAITHKIDGNYVFFQLGWYSEGKYLGKSQDIEAMRFNIQNGALEGEWKITTKSGGVIEQGQYKNGKKDGKWNFWVTQESDAPNVYRESKKEEIIFEDGVEKKNITYISSFVFHKEEDFFIKEKRLVNGKLKSVKYFDVYRKKRLKKAKLQN